MTVLKVLAKSMYISVLVVGTGVCITEIITSIISSKRGDNNEDKGIKGYEGEEGNRRK